MRFLLVVCIWCVFIGGLWVYTAAKNAQRTENSQHVVEVHRARASYSAAITLTFALEKDPFALVSEESEGKSIEAWLNGVELSFDEDSFTQGNKNFLHEIEGVLVGVNEIFIKASPPVNSEMSAHGARLQIFENDVVIVDETAWSGDGAIVTGSYIFTIGEVEGDEHSH